MPTYKAPLNDYKFIIENTLNSYELYSSIPAFNDVAPDFVNTILAESARFAEQEIQPLNQIGDTEGCKVVDGEVLTPNGFKQVNDKYMQSGWTQLSESPEYGGQGLPFLLNGAISEMNLSACAAFAIYTTRDGAIAAIEKNASQSLKETYLPKLIDGTWGGPMCMSEPHCGSDLGLLQTKAVPQDSLENATIPALALLKKKWDSMAALLA